MWQLVGATYVLGVAALTALVAHRKGRGAVYWFIGGLVGGFVILLLAVIAPRAGQPWRSRALVAIALFAVIAVLVVLLIVAISEANFVTP